MTITPNDIKLLASARMTDAADGGGPMTSTALQDGAENNVFPDISSVDRTFGRFALRKVYAAVLAAGTDTLLGANMIVADEPDDAAVGTFIFSATASESRAGALARLEQSHWEPLGPGGSGVLYWDNAAFVSEGVYCLRGSAAALVAAGSVIYTQVGSVYSMPVLIMTAAAGATSGTTGGRVVTFHGTVQMAAPYYAKMGVPSTATPRIAGTAAVVGALSAGATTCTVDSVLTPVAPLALGAEPAGATALFIDAARITPAARAVCLRGGDAVVVHHTADTSPVTVAATDTIACGRTGLARAIVRDAAGQAVAGGYTVNRATGVVTVGDPTGWAQPVSVRHTIEDVVGLTRTGYPEVRQTASTGGESSTGGPFELRQLGITMYCGRPNVARLRVYSHAGQDITELLFSAANLNLAAGTAYYAGAGNEDFAVHLVSYSPVTVVGSGVSGDALATPTAPQANPNLLTFNRGLARDFPAGALVSSALLLGDLQAQAGAPWSQETWTDVWADARLGDPIVAQYNVAAYPIAVDNRGAVTERWAIIFLTSTTFRLVGETLGQVATGDVNTPLAPTNPATGQPYFTLAPLGWGSGWAAGNVLRHNTRGANAAAWVARVVMPSAPSETPDSLTLAIRGDIDA